MNIVETWFKNHQNLTLEQYNTLKELVLEDSIPKVKPKAEEKPKRSYRKKTPNLGYVNKTPIKAHILEKLRETPLPLQKEVLNKLIPNLKTATARKYLYAYRTWMKKHPTTKDIAKKLQKNRPDTGDIIKKVGAVFIKTKPFADYKEKPTRETLLKYYSHLTPSSLDTYENCYRQYLKQVQQAEEINVKPDELKNVKAKMVTLWRQGLPINKSNLQAMFKELSSKKLSAILNALIKDRQVKYHNDSNTYEVVF